MDESRRDKGFKLFAEVYGQKTADQARAHLDAGADFGLEQTRWTFEFTMGSVWSRPGIERKLRSCAVLGMLIAQRAHNEIKAHVRMGMKNGLTRTELEEIFYTAIPYCGFPAANAGKTAILEALAEIEAAEK